MSSTRTVPWQDGFRAFFDLAGLDWTPPATIRTAVNARRDLMTVVGRFRRPDGEAVKLTIRCRREDDGVWYAVEQIFDLRLRFGGDDR